jgi:drug/metabolite transporter (DMT)-like permease
VSAATPRSPWRPRNASSGAVASGPARDATPTVPPPVALGVAVLAISWAAILVRWASAPPLVVGAYRLGMAAGIFWVAAAVRPASLAAPWTGARLAAVAAASIFLAAHFGLWIASLELTSVASSVLLVSTQPVFVAVLGRLFLGERVPPRSAIGIALALGGSVLITGGGLLTEGGAWRGDLLALGGALALAAHYLLLRRLRPHVDLLPLMALETPLAAGWLFAAAALAGAPLTGYPPRTYALFLLLALVPTAVGHTLLNWALRYRKAYEVNVAVLGEPLGATLLAYLIFGERPALHVLAGGALVLLGIALAWAPVRATTGRGAPIS